MEDTPRPAEIGDSEKSERPGAADAPALPALLGRAILGTVAALAVSVAFSVLTLSAGYAGAHDDAAVSQAVARYDAFLTATARALVIVGAAQALCLAPVTLGLLLLVARISPVSPGALSPRSRSSSALVTASAGLVVVLAYFLVVAHRYPGLFLSTLAGSHLLTLAARRGSAIAAVVLSASIVGYVGMLRGRTYGRGAKVLAAVLVSSFAGIGFGWEHLRGPSHVFGNPDVKAIKGVKKRRPNILVLAVDSLRPDMIDGARTPNIARLVEQSVYFPNALVTVPRTGPSWAATLTSLSPLVNGIETMFPTARLGRLKTISLPAHLASLGYRTAVFSEYAGEFFGRADFGFQVSAVPTVELKEIAGQMLLMRAPTVLAGVGDLYAQGTLGRALLGQRVTNLVRGMSNFAHPDVLLADIQTLGTIDRPAEGTEPAPFFSLVFYSQPHFPYTSSSQFYERHRVPGSSPELAFGRDATNETPVTSAADHEQLVGLYRAALEETDTAVGKLLDALSATGELDRTIVVLMADHGEGLYECSTCVGHGDNLRSMLTLRVPLAFRMPPRLFADVTPSRQDTYVSQLDVYPTLLALLGQERMAQHEGLPLLDSHGQLATIPERTHFAETGEWLWPTPAVPRDRVRYPNITQLATLEGNRIVIDEKFNPEIRAAKYRAAVRPPYKLSYEPGASSVSYRLYRIDRDPHEEHDLAAAEPGVLADLENQLTESMLRHPKILPVAGYFLTRPDAPAPESW